VECFWIHDFPALRILLGRPVLYPRDSHQQLSLPPTAIYLIYYHHLRECHLPSHITTFMHAWLTTDGKPDLLYSSEHSDLSASIFLEIHPAMWRSPLRGGSAWGGFWEVLGLSKRVSFFPTHASEPHHLLLFLFFFDTKSMFSLSATDEPGGN
jgi:hypothetical protein